MFSVVHREVPKGAMIGLPCIEMLGGFTECSLLFSIYDGRGDGRCDGGGDFVLNGEDVGQIAVIPRRPDVSACRGVDELACYANTIACGRTLPSNT